MDDRCWELIEDATPRDGAGSEEHVDAVSAALEEWSPEEIIRFDVFIHEQLERAYRWDLWAVAHIALGGCGDDSFEYFRLWLIAQGQKYFERALEHPERAADAIKPGEPEAECELLLYAAQDAFEATAGEELPDPESGSKSEPEGDPWDESTVAALYPKLAQRFFV